jgi:hypothetical protein
MLERPLRLGGCVNAADSRARRRGHGLYPFANERARGATAAELWNRALSSSRLASRRQPSHHLVGIHRNQGLRLSETPPDPNLQIVRLPVPNVMEAAPSALVVGFNRGELQAIFNLYGRMVAQGLWRDYAMDFSASQAVFSIFRRNGEAAFYRIVKEPKAIRKQGAYSVVTQTGLILKRGPDLARVLAVLEKKPKLVAV